ncbi:MAG: dipeptidyl aminopeptidase/acylaminoacyl peptidase, partial [Planctomycetota bacterium]
HGGNRYKERWVESGFVEDFAGDKYHVLAIDIRGRGESEAGDAQALRRDPTLAWADVSAALDWLVQQDEVDAERIALVGSSYGANLATTGMRLFDWPVCTLVCFSATAAGYRWPTGDAELKALPSGLYLASAGEVERYAAEETANRLAEETAGEYEVHIYNGPVHAQVIYALEPSTEILVAGWLEEQFSDKPGWSPPE